MSDVWKYSTRGRVKWQGIDLECGVYKQIEGIVSDFIIARWSMLKLYNIQSVLHINKPILHNDRCIANSSHLTCNGKQ